jgi:hypothetical protein
MIKLFSIINIYCIILLLQQINTVSLAQPPCSVDGNDLSYLTNYEIGGWALNGNYNPPIKTFYIGVCSYAAALVVVMLKYVGVISDTIPWNIVNMGIWTSSVNK